MTQPDVIHNAAGPCEPGYHRFRPDCKQCRCGAMVVGEQGVITARTIEQAAEAVRPCPECRAGKHGNCNGMTWDVRIDGHTDCPCAVANHAERSSVNRMSSQTLQIQVVQDNLDGGWIAECTSLPGCMSEGETEEEVIGTVTDAITEVRLAVHAETHFGSSVCRAGCGYWPCEKWAEAAAAGSAS